MALSIPTTRPDRLRQGEVLSNLREPRLQLPSSNPEQAEALQVDWFVHRRSLLMTADCDLVGDYRARDQAPSENKRAEARRLARQLEYVTCCPLYAEDEMRTGSGFDSDVWKRVRQNENERYHVIKLPTLEGFEHLPDVYLDFNRTFLLPVEYAYSVIQRPDVLREGPIPPPWCQQVVQRWSSYQGRVCVPDADDTRP